MRTGARRIYSPEEYTVTLSAMECVLTPRFAVLAVAAAVCDDCEVLSNGERVDAAATPASLDAKARAAYALDGLKTTTSGAEWVGHAAGRGASKTSPWAVWTTGRLLSKEECESWISRGEALTYDTGDYIYKTGKNGYEKAPTGARRHSATRLVEDSAFAESMTKRLFDGVHGVPLKLADGREFRGVRPTFLISKYDAEQYFAPHFDGAMLSPDNTQLSAFTAVLFLNDDFDGGHTHYLPGAGSEVRGAKRGPLVKNAQAETTFGGPKAAVCRSKSLWRCALSAAPPVSTARCRCCTPAAA
mmetsp:Transcript_1329/g.4698  ORF Transcript_1329/g.4698 Transcript_1329/m.4698 type:complete len:301 (+) Transcript_1329:22-924(+)